MDNLARDKNQLKSVRSDAGLSSPSSGSSSPGLTTGCHGPGSWHCRHKLREKAPRRVNSWQPPRVGSHSHGVVWSTVCPDHVLISLSHLSSPAPYSSQQRFLTRLWWLWTRRHGAPGPTSDICGPTVGFLYQFSLVRVLHIHYRPGIIIVIAWSGDSIYRDDDRRVRSRFPPAPEYHLYL